MVNYSSRWPLLTEKLIQNNKQLIFIFILILMHLSFSLRCSFLLFMTVAASCERASVSSNWERAEKRGFFAYLYMWRFFLRNGFLVFHLAKFDLLVMRMLVWFLISGEKWREVKFLKLENSTDLIFNNKNRWFSFNLDNKYCHFL